MFPPFPRYQLNIEPIVCDTLYDSMERLDTWELPKILEVKALFIVRSKVTILSQPLELVPIHVYVPLVV